MRPGFIARFRARGPWRLGPDSGARNRVDRVLHSDRLYSAVSSAMARMGMLDEWLAATFQNPHGPAIRFSSGFPCQEDLLFLIPPRNLWPPPASAKVRWKGARFVPLPVVRALLAEEALDEDRWTVDGLSECLVPSDWPARPCRPAARSNAAVDRSSEKIAVHTISCLEFSRGAGMWALAVFADEEARERWSGPVRAALRLLADSGVGAKRTLGWGHSEEPDFIDGMLPDLILPPPAETPPVPEGAAQPPSETVYWLLSLFSPAPEDAVDWQRGDYALLTRAGRTDSPVSRVALKKLTRMVAEGSVIFSQTAVTGAAHDVAPDGFPHAVYRAGFALAIPIPWRATP